MRNLILGAALAISSLFGITAHAEPVLASSTSS